MVVANSLKDEDRATGFSMVTALSLIPTVFAPLAAGVILTHLGGLTVGSVRVLFLLELVGVALIGLYVGLRLEETESLGKRGRSLIQELRAVMSGGPYLKRWLLIDTMSASSFAVMVRFVMVYSVEEKGVNPLTLGAMSTAYALVGILSAIPLGKLADRIGWVRTVILIRPLFHISTLILLFTPDPRWIILGWALRGTLPAEFEHPRGLPERAGVPLGAWEMDGDPGAPPGDLQDTRAGLSRNS